MPLPGLVSWEPLPFQGPWHRRPSEALGRGRGVGACVVDCARLTESPFWTFLPIFVQFSSLFLLFPDGCLPEVLVVLMFTI